MEAGESDLRRAAKASLDHSKALSATGLYDSAIKSLRTELDRLKEQGVQGRERADLAFELGEIEAKHVRKMKEAEADMRESVETECRLDPASELAAVAGIQLGRIQLERQLYLPARLTFQSVLTYLPAHDSPNYLFAQAYLGWTYRCLGDLDVAEPMITESLEKCRDLHPKSRQMGLILKLYLSILIERMQYSLAKRCFRQLIEDSQGQASEHPEDLAIVYSIQAHYYVARGRIPKACQTFARALALHTQHYPGSGRTVLCCVEAAKCYAKYGRIQQAKAAFDELITRLEEIDTTNSVLAQAWAHKGDVLAKIDQDQEAANCYEIAATVYEELGDMEQEIECLLKLGNLLVRYNTEEAEAKYTTALQLARILDNPATLAQVLSKMGLFYRCSPMNSIKKATECYTEALIQRRSVYLRFIAWPPASRQRGGLGLRR